MPVNVNIVFPPSAFLISISSTTMPSSTKATSTSALSTTSMAKTTETNKAVTDASSRETSMEIKKKKKKQIMDLSAEVDEEREEKSSNNNMQYDLKVNKVKRKYKILMDSLQDMETAEADFCQCSIRERS